MMPIIKKKFVNKNTGTHSLIGNHVTVNVTVNNKEIYRAYCN